MAVEPSSLVRIAALVRTGEPPEDRVRAAERQLREVLEEVNALDAELEALSEALAAFSRAHDEALADGYARVERVDRVVTRLQLLQNAVRALLEALRSAETVTGRRQRKGPAARKRAKRWTPPVPEEGEPGEDDSAAAEGMAAAREDEAKVLKRLFRRLARILHPDLAQDDAERTRLHTLMSQVNDAYERGDRTTLELLAEKVGAGEPPGALTEDERLLHLERRTRALEEARSSLRRQREQWRATATYRLSQEHAKRQAEGRDFFEETKRELDEEEVAALADAWHRLASLQRAASALSAEWGQSMDKSLEQAPKQGRALRAFDPVLESPLVRRGLERLEEHRASDAARALARELEERAASAPWDVALTLLAYFAERAQRPPEGLRTQQDWKDRYEALRGAWPDAPTFERALTALPSWLELGMRTQQRQVHAGLQLKDASLAAGVSIALAGEAVAELARDVFVQLGPVDTCKGCEARGALVHLLRTRGLDELNALVCAACGKVAKRYFIFSRNDGLEALQPDALKLEVVAEQVVRFGGAAIAFQMLPAERERLTAGDVLDRFAECYVTPYKLELSREQLELHHRARRLRANARVPEEAVLTLRLSAKAGLSAKETLALLKSRIERRFRPDAPGA